MATLIEMPDTAARALRAEAEDLWGREELIARSLQSADFADHDGDGARDEQRVIMR
jgi:hypothetical protein